jgi:tetratricopeptide (TPR) repeat protein
MIGAAEPGRDNGHEEAKEMKTMEVRRMHRIKMGLAVALAAMVMPLTAPSLLAQEAASGAKIHGHVQDPTGLPLKGGTVSLSTDEGKTSKYSFKTDDSGNYTGDGIAPGTYTVIYRNPETPPDKVVDQFDNVKITAGADVTQDFDMTRPEYFSKLTPEQRKQAEALKAKNQGVMKENAVIKNLNADLKEARQDNADKKYDAAEALMTKDTQAKPDAAVLWVELGIAQKGLKKNDDAVTSLQKAVQLDSAGGKPNSDIEAAANDALGEVLITMGKIPEAQAAYEAAAKAAATKDPKLAAMHYSNEAIMMYKANNAAGTTEPADKAIAADPSKPLPYYLKGWALLNQGASIDPKTQKMILPPGCAEAYQKYLELDPNGQFAADAEAILKENGSSVQTKYKAGKKS